MTLNFLFLLPSKTRSNNELHYGPGKQQAFCCLLISVISVLINRVVISHFHLWCIKVVKLSIYNGLILYVFSSAVPLIAIMTCVCISSICCFSFQCSSSWKADTLQHDKSDCGAGNMKSSKSRVSSLRVLYASMYIAQWESFLGKTLT